MWRGARRLASPLQPASQPLRGPVGGSGDGHSCCRQTNACAPPPLCAIFPRHSLSTCRHFHCLPQFHIARALTWAAILLRVSSRDSRRQQLRLLVCRPPLSPHRSASRVGSASRAAPMHRRCSTSLPAHLMPVRCVIFSQQQVLAGEEHDVVGWLALGTLSSLAPAFIDRLLPERIYRR